MNHEKAYLGDSVYAQNDGFGIILTTENGYGPSNTIYLEPSVYTALLDYVAKCSQTTLKGFEQ